MAKVRDLIRGSLRLIGAVATGETPSAEESADALVSLNDMVDTWSADSLFIYSKLRESFPLQVGKQTYTMGIQVSPAPDFSAVRPIRIEDASIQDSNGLEIPIQILNVDQWAAIHLKATTGALPTRIYAEGTYPLETINVWPVPSVVKNLVLYSWKPLASFATLDDVISLPPGYSKALRYGLAIELAPEYGKPIEQVWVDQFNEAKSVVKRLNDKPLYLSCDPMTLSRRGYFNILTGE